MTKGRALRLGALVLVGLVIAAEIGLRVIGLGDPPLAVRDAELEYRLVPNGDYRRWGNEISINSHGFRTADHPDEVPAGETRVLLIGDSVVYGNHFLDQSETVSLRLSDLLSTPDCTVRVIPMAVSSWGPVNQAAALARHGSFGAAQIALVVSGHDLVDMPIEGGSLIPYRTSPAIGAIGDAIEAVLERQGERARNPLSFDERVVASLAALDSIADHARRENAELLFVYNATVPERASGTSENGQRLMDWAVAQGIDIIDLGAVGDVSYRDAIHPDAPGAGAIARTLHEAYAQRVGCQTP